MELYYERSLYSIPRSQGFGTKEEEEEDIFLRIEKVIQKSPYQS